MRTFIDIVSEAPLYRGDTQSISLFRDSYGEEKHLYGNGVYLTSDPKIAREYSVGRRGMAYGDTKSKAIRAAVDRIIDEEFDWDAIKESVKEHWLGVLYSSDKSEHDEIRQKFQDATNAAYADMMAKAVGILKNKKPRISRSPNGRWAVIGDDATGVVTNFEIPEDVLSRVLDADAPLPERVIEALSAALTSGDFRDDEGIILDDNSFASWVEQYRSRGTIFAWENRVIGGTGRNPSLSDYVNGTHDGSSRIHQNRNILREIIEPLGFTGISFKGGVVSNNKHNQVNRGGGSSPHTVYVIWDSRIINQSRTGSEEITFDRARIPKIEAPKIVD